MRRPPHRSTATASWLAVCLVLSQATIAPASAADPSARELWRTYPLHPREAQGKTRGVTPTSIPAREPAGTPESKPASGAASNETPIWAIGGLVACVAAAAVATVLLRRRSRGGESVAGRARDEPDAEPQAAADHSRATETQPVAPGPERPPELEPPDPSTRWDAQLQWRQEMAGSHFWLRAATGDDVAELGRSEGVEWPPAGQASVEALVAAHADFEASVVAAGWKPVITDGPWYATSFVWEPKPRGPSGDWPQRRSDSWAATREDEAERELNERFRRGRNERHAEKT